MKLRIITKKYAVDSAMKFPKKSISQPKDQRLRSPERPAASGPNIRAAGLFANNLTALSAYTRKVPDIGLKRKKSPPKKLEPDYLKKLPQTLRLRVKILSENVFNRPHDQSFIKVIDIHGQI